MSSTISAGTTSGTAIAISGDTSGQLVLQTNGTTTAVTISTGQVVTLAQPLPVASGGSGVITSTGSGANALATSPTLTTPVLSGSVTGTYTLAGTPTMGASLITSGTAVATTSGTSITFTGIPSWVKRVTVMLNGVSTNGTSIFVIRLGTSGGIVSTGYYGSACDLGGTGRLLFTTGFYIGVYNTASHLWSGTTCIQNLTGNTWIGTGLLLPNVTDAGGVFGGGNALGATLDRISLTTVNGTDTFDAGSINILYE